MSEWRDIDESIVWPELERERDELRSELETWLADEARAIPSYEEYVRKVLRLEAKENARHP